MKESRRSLLRKTTGLSVALAGVGTASAHHKDKHSKGGGPKEEDESGDTTKDGGDEPEPVDENPKGPSGEWSLVLDEQWAEFNEDRWAVGFIDHEDWIPDDDASVSAEHVTVANGQCTLQIESNGTGPSGCFQGVINSSPGGEDWHPNEGIGIDPDPGQYVEARIKMPGRTGILPGFWGHPANTNWPPEIDIVELFQWGDDVRSDRETLHVNAHWTSTGEPMDMDNHEHDPYSMDTGVDLTETYNTFGCAWFEDRLEWYFNGEHVLTRDSPDELFETLNHDESRPFGLCFSNHVNRLGEAALDEAWTEEMVIDWVRVWEIEGAAPDDSEESAESDPNVLDDFDSGEFAEGWGSTGSWTLVESPDGSESGSYSAYVDEPWSRLTWNGEPSVGRGTTLAIDFAFDESVDQQFNVRFGAADNPDTGSYRLDVHRDEITLLDTDGWQWLGSDDSYANDSIGAFHTAEINFGDGEITVTVDGTSSGTIRRADTTYTGDVVHFDIDTGGAFIDEVRIVDQ